MLHDFYTLDFGSAINARYQQVWASCLMLVDVLPDAFCLAKSESFTFDWLVMADLIMVLHLDV